MAAKLSLEVGQTSGERVFGDQAKAAALLDRFYAVNALGPEDATNKQKLDAIAAHLAQYMTNQVREAHVQEGRRALRQEAETDIGVD